MPFLLRVQRVPAGQLVCGDGKGMDQWWPLGQPSVRVAAFEDRTAANQTSKLKGPFGGQK